MHCLYICVCVYMYVYMHAYVCIYTCQCKAALVLSFYIYTCIYSIHPGDISYEILNWDVSNFKSSLMHCFVYMCVCIHICQCKAALVLSFYVHIYIYTYTHIHPGDIFYGILNSDVSKFELSTSAVADFLP